MSSILARTHFKLICRLCAEESSELIRLHIRQPKQRCLKDSIKKYVGVKATPNDGLPDQVCGPCIAKLDEASEFIDKCLKTQKKFETIVADAELEEEGTSAASEDNENFTIKDEPYEGETSNHSLVHAILGNEESSKQDQILNIETESNDKSNPSDPNVEEEEEDLIHQQDDNSTLSDSEDPKGDECEKTKIHECNQCSKSYAKLRSLKTHQRRVHEKSMEKCPKCEKVLSSNYLWNYHILVHSDVRPHPCTECHKAFKTKHEATKHMKTHIPIEDRYNFSCEICGKRFTNKGNLSTHIKLHSDERPFVCDQCGKSFRHKGSLEDHQLAHKGEKSFICNICGKGFFRVQALAVHERCHTGSRPYFCNQCGKSFRSSKVLKRHELIHSDSRPYPCQYCGKGFRDHGKRKVHERIHTGERPYECNLCPVAFYESGNLKKHLQKVHKQPKSINIRLRKDENESAIEVQESKGESGYQPNGPFTNSPPHPQPMETGQMTLPSNPLLGHTIFSSIPNNMGMGFLPPPTHHAPY